jgi:hypothetical protein
MIHSISRTLLLLLVLQIDTFVRGIGDVIFVLYSARGVTGDPIVSIKNGDTFDFSVVGKDLTVITELPDLGTPKVTVKFSYEDEERLDRTSPYSLAGDQSSIGRYVPSNYLRTVGTKTITINVLKANATILTDTITFEIVDSGVVDHSIEIDNLFLVQANKPKRESMLALISDGMTVDLLKIFATDPSLAKEYPLPLALYVRFKGPVQATSINFNFFYNSSYAINDFDGSEGTIGKLNSDYESYDILPDLTNPGYKTVTINAYDDSSSPLIFTKTYHFTILADPSFVAK